MNSEKDGLVTKKKVFVQEVYEMRKEKKKKIDERFKGVHNIK